MKDLAAIECPREVSVVVGRLREGALVSLEPGSRVIVTVLPRFPEGSAAPAGAHLIVHESVGRDRAALWIGRAVLRTLGMSETFPAVEDGPDPAIEG